MCYLKASAHLWPQQCVCEWGKVWTAVEQRQGAIVKYHCGAFNTLDTRTHTDGLTHTHPVVSHIHTDRSNKREIVLLFGSLELCFLSAFPFNSAALSLLFCWSKLDRITSCLRLTHRSHQSCLHRWDILFSLAVRLSTARSVAAQVYVLRSHHRRKTRREAIERWRRVLISPDQLNCKQDTAVNHDLLQR